MKHSLIILMLVAAGGVQAQGFADEPTCYSWNGGHKSAGSFSKCPQPFVVAKAPAAAPAPAVVAAPVVPAPIVQQTCAPPPKPVVKPKRKAPVKC